jgi:hypothetical protein
LKAVQVVVGVGWHTAMAAKASSLIALLLQAPAVVADSDSDENQQTADAQYV